MFQIGDKIAHPMHGAGVIENIEDRMIDGRLRRCYSLRLPVGNMLVTIPEDACEAVGVRPILSAEAAEEVINAIVDLEPEMTQNWNQRYRENMLRLKSGDLLEVARVIKGLLEREVGRGLSTGERKMLRSAKQILLSELVMAQNKTYPEMESRLSAVFTTARPNA